jgi:hypothetical protein
MSTPSQIATSTSPSTPVPIWAGASTPDHEAAAAARHRQRIRHRDHARMELLYLVNKQSDIGTSPQRCHLEFVAEVIDYLGGCCNQSTRSIQEWPLFGVSMVRSYRYKQAY